MVKKQKLRTFKLKHEHATENILQCGNTESWVIVLFHEYRGWERANYWCWKTIYHLTGVDTLQTLVGNSCQLKHWTVCSQLRFNVFRWFIWISVLSLITRWSLYFWLIFFHSMDTTAGLCTLRTVLSNFRSSMLLWLGRGLPVAEQKILGKEFRFHSKLPSKSKIWGARSESAGSFNVMPKII